jgi:hypothetical protein
LFEGVNVMPDDNWWHQKSKEIQHDQGDLQRSTSRAKTSTIETEIPTRSSPIKSHVPLHNGSSLKRKMRPSPLRLTKPSRSLRALKLLADLG